MDIWKRPGLSLALYGSYWAMKLASWWPSIGNLLSTEDFSMVIKTRDGKSVRQFLVINGRVSSKNKDYPVPDLSIIWASPSIYFQTLLDTFSGNPKALIRAIVNGDLELEGEARQVMRLLTIMTELAATSRASV